MAKINQGILGGLRGTVGNVIGGSWKGINYIRSTPVSVSNPRTAGQLLQRGKLTTLSQLASSLLSEIIKPLIDRFAVQMSGYNQFTKWNMPAMVSEGVVDLSLLVQSRGKMAAVTPSTSGISAASTEIYPLWSAALTDAYAQGTDKAYMTLIREDGTVIGVSAGVATRADAECVVSISETLKAGDKCRFILSFLRNDGTVVSDSAVSAEIIVTA